MVNVGLVTGSLVFGLASQDTAENALAELGCTGLRFKAPVHLGDTIYAYTDVVAKAPLGAGFGALRVKLQAAKNVDPSVETLAEDDPRRVLVLDCWLAVVDRR